MERAAGRVHLWGVMPLCQCGASTSSLVGQCVAARALEKSGRGGEKAVVVVVALLLLLLLLGEGSGKSCARGTSVARRSCKAALKAPSSSASGAQYAAEKCSV